MRQKRRERWRRFVKIFLSKREKMKTKLRRKTKIEEEEEKRRGGNMDEQTAESLLAYYGVACFSDIIDSSATCVTCSKIKAILDIHGRLQFTLDTAK